MQSFIRIYSKVLSIFLIAYLFTNSFDPTIRRCNIYKPKAKIEEKMKYTEKNSEGKLYVLLVNGKKRALFERLTHRFPEEMKRMCKLFLKEGVPESQIYVLDAESKVRNTTSFEPTEKGLDEAIYRLSERIGKNDRFLLYVTSHGSKTWEVLPIGESTIILKDKQITETEFEGKLRKIKPSYSIMVFSQCFSGGFAKRLGKENTIAVSNVKSSRVSKSLGICPFVKYFFPALFGDLPRKEKIEVDKNSDGSVSVEEAFNYVAKKDIFSSPFANLVLLKNTYQLISQVLDPSKISLDRRNNYSNK